MGEAVAMAGCLAAEGVERLEGISLGARSLTSSYSRLLPTLGPSEVSTTGAFCSFLNRKFRGRGFQAWGM